MQKTIIDESWLHADLIKYINTGKEKVTEFAMRLSGGFFIYHFLRATRKYVKD